MHREQRTLTPSAEIRESSKLNLVKQEAQVMIIRNLSYKSSENIQNRQSSLTKVLRVFQKPHNFFDIMMKGIEKIKTKMRSELPHKKCYRETD